MSDNERLERYGRALAEDYGDFWESLTEEERETWRRAGKAAIAVADEETRVPQHELTNHYHVIMENSTPVGAARSLEDAKHKVETLQEDAIGPVDSRCWKFWPATSMHVLLLSIEAAPASCRWYIVSVPAGDRA